MSRETSPQDNCLVAVERQPDAKSKAIEKSIAVCLITFGITRGAFLVLAPIWIDPHWRTMKWVPALGLGANYAIAILFAAVEFRLVLRSEARKRARTEKVNEIKF